MSGRTYLTLARMMEMGPNELRAEWVRRYGDRTRPSGRLPLSCVGRSTGAAKELHDLLEARGVKVWFSEKDIALGEPSLREIDRGLAKSRVGIVLVTPDFLKRIRGHSIADKKLPVLLNGGKLVPIIHRRAFQELMRRVPCPHRAMDLVGRRHHGRCRDQGR